MALWSSYEALFGSGVQAIAAIEVALFVDSTSNQRVRDIVGYLTTSPYLCRAMSAHWLAENRSNVMLLLIKVWAKGESRLFTFQP